MRACSLFCGSLLVTQILTCSYVPPLEKDVLFGNAEYAVHHGKYKAMSKKREWDWIRIKIVYDRSVNRLSEKQNKIVRKLVLSARKYFQGTLKVQRLHTLQLRPSCAENRGGVYESGLTECDTNCKKMCGGAHAPGTAIYYSECRCAYGPCPTREIWGGKLKHTDFLLFVTIDQTKCGTTTRAYAAHCSMDKQSKRPIAGYVNICPNFLSEIEEHGDAHWLATIKHELLHVFAFSASLYPSFVGARKSSAKKGVVPGVLERVVRRDWETATGFVPHEVKMIVTPRVREEARKYFNCPSLEGAEVENQGGSGSAASHWEERLFRGEAMNAASDSAGAVSRLTLALLEDSGWYKPNYNKAEYMSWGLGRGCTFAKKSCLTWMKTHRKDPYPFCTKYEDVRCDENRMSKTLCDVKPTRVLPPPQYNYNIKHLYHNMKGQPFYGIGLDENADYCPHYRIFLHSVAHNKNGGDSRCTYSGNSNFNYTLEEFSPTARCFELSGKNVTIGTPLSYYYAVQVGCYEVDLVFDCIGMGGVEDPNQKLIWDATTQRLLYTSCDNGHLMVKARNSKFHQCNHKGQVIEEIQYVRGIGNVTLSIVCPSTNEICEGNAHKIFRPPRDSCGYEKEDGLKASALLMLTFLYGQI